MNQEKNVPKIRVLIGQKLSTFYISGKDIIYETLAKKEQKVLSKNLGLKFDCNIVPYQPKKIRLLSKLKSKKGVLFWNKIPYHGTMEVLIEKRKKGCQLVYTTKLESYLSSLLAKEMSAHWPIEALKAQAVAARSYAYHRIDKNKKRSHDYYDLENSEKDQVGGSYFDQTLSTNLATHQTKGEILVTMKGNLVPIFFHSKCGGKTLLPREVWGNSIEGYISVRCPHCYDLGKPSWTHSLSSSSFNRIISTLGAPQIKNNEVTLIPDYSWKRDLRFYINDELNVINKSRFRKILGRKKIPGNNFKLEKNENQIIFKGKGNGHGVGMCQYGAYKMALDGYSYKEILSFYFPKMKLVKKY